MRLKEKTRDFYIKENETTENFTAWREFVFSFITLRNWQWTCYSLCFRSAMKIDYPLALWAQVLTDMVLQILFCWADDKIQGSCERYLSELHCEEEVVLYNVFAGINKIYCMGGWSLVFKMAVSNSKVNSLFLWPDFPGLYSLYVLFMYCLYCRDGWMSTCIGHLRTMEESKR